MKILTNKKLNQEIQNFLKENCVDRKLDMDAWAWYNLPSSDNYDYILLLEWQDGYDKDEHSDFIKEGYGLNASIRIDEGQMFKYDNPYPICSKQGDCIDGYSIEFVDVKNGFKNLTHALLQDYKLALKSEQFADEFLG